MGCTFESSDGLLTPVGGELPFSRIRGGLNRRAQVSP
jgi:hypothetical protein